MKGIRTGRSGEAPVISGLRCSIMLSCALLLCASAGAGEPAKRETPLEKAKRLAASNEKKERVEALRWLKALAKPGTTGGDEAAFLYAELCLRFHREGERAALLAARKAFTALRDGSGGRWGLRGRIGLYRLLAVEGKKKEAVENLNRFLLQQTKCERAVEAAYFLGCINAGDGKSLKDLTEARRAIQYSLKLCDSIKRYHTPIISPQAIRAKLNWINRRIREIEAGKLKTAFKAAERKRKAKKYNEAIKMFSAISKGFPGEDLAELSGLRVAQCHFWKGDRKTALAKAQAFVSAEPRGRYRGHAHLLMGDILLEYHFNAQLAEHEFAAVLFPGGYDQKTRKTTILTGDRLAADRPDRTWSAVLADAHMRYGLCRYMRRDFSTATRHFEAEIALRPTQKFGKADMPSNMRFLIEMCRRKEYPVRFHRHVMRGDNRVQTVLFLASAYGEAGQHAKALRLLQRVTKGELGKKTTLPEQIGYAKYEEAEMLRLLFREKEAVAAFQTFVDKKNAGLPMAPQALLELAALHFSLNEYATGEKIYLAIVERYPKHPAAAKALYNYGYSKYFAKKWRDCERAFKTLAVRFPNTWEGKRVRRVELPYVTEKARKLRQQ